MGMYFRFKDEVFHSVMRPYDHVPLEKLFKEYFSEEAVMTDIAKPKASVTSWCSIWELMYHPIYNCRVVQVLEHVGEVSENPGSKWQTQTRVKYEKHRASLSKKRQPWTVNAFMAYGDSKFYETFCIECQALEHGALLTQHVHHCYLVVYTPILVFVGVRQQLTCKPSIDSSVHSNSIKA